MKIVLFGPVFPFRGGIAQFGGVLARSLEAAGHEVHLVNFKKQFPRLLFPGKTQFDDSPQALRVPSVRVFVPWNPLSWRRTAREIERHSPDLIVFQWWMPFFGLGYWGVIRALGKRSRERLVFLLHNVIPHERRPGDRFLSRLALRKARYYVPLSRTEEREMHRLFPEVPHDSVRYSPHPIYDCYRPFEGSREEARNRIGIHASRLLLFFGFVRQYKGLDLLLRAMPEILKRDPNLKLVIVGEFYQDREPCDRQIRDLGISEAVVIREGYISGDDVGPYFAAADCVVLPYRSATQSGIVQVAYALATPVITTRVGGLAEVVKDCVTGYIVPPEDAGAIAAAVSRFFEAGGRAAFEPNVRSEARRYSWEAMVETITSFAGRPIEH